MASNSVDDCEFDDVVVVVTLVVLYVFHFISFSLFVSFFAFCLLLLHWNTIIWLENNYSFALVI